MQSRRDFLGSIACAFAVAAIPCRIPTAAIVEAPYDISDASLMMVEIELVPMSGLVHPMLVRACIDYQNRVRSECGVALYSIAHPESAS